MFLILGLPWNLLQLKVKKGIVPWRFLLFFSQLESFSRNEPWCLCNIVSILLSNRWTTAKLPLKPPNLVRVACGWQPGGFPVA